MDRTIIVEIHDNELHIGEDNSSVSHYVFPKDVYTLDDIVKAVGDYIYMYCSDVDGNV